MSGQGDHLPAVARAFGVRVLPPSDSSTDRLPTTALSAFQQLHTPMRAVFGAAGCDLLFRRALGRAAAEHPVLRVALAAEDPEQLVRALQGETDRRPTDIGAALRAIMEAEISLLARFIGEDLVEAVLMAGNEPPSQDHREPHHDE